MSKPILYIEKYLDKIKNHLPMILLLPPILGGLWQLVELSKMSVSFIRFFSPTQLLPDGLLILFIAISFYISFKLARGYKIRLQRKVIQVGTDKPKGKMNTYFLSKNRNNRLVYIDNPIYRKDIDSFLFNLFVVLLPTCYLIYLITSTDFFNDFFNHFNLLTFLFYWILFILIIKVVFTSLLIIIVHIIDSKLYSKIKFYCTNKPFVKEIVLLPFKLLTLYIIFISAVFLFFVISFFHKEYLLPKNLKNLEYIKDSLNNQDFNESKISYFNDKYIFIEHKNRDNNVTIEIIKFDELLKNQNDEKKLKLFFEKLQIK